MILILLNSPAPNLLYLKRLARSLHPRITGFGRWRSVRGVKKKKARHAGGFVGTGTAQRLPRRDHFSLISL